MTQKNSVPSQQGASFFYKMCQLAHREKKRYVRLIGRLSMHDSDAAAEELFNRYLAWCRKNSGQTFEEFVRVELANHRRNVLN